MAEARIENRNRHIQLNVSFIQQLNVSHEQKSDMIRLFHIIKETIERIKKTRACAVLASTAINIYVKFIADIKTEQVHMERFKNELTYEVIQTEGLFLAEDIDFITYFKDTYAQN